MVLAWKVHEVVLCEDDRVRQENERWDTSRNNTSGLKGVRYHGGLMVRLKSATGNLMRFQIIKWSIRKKQNQTCILIIIIYHHYLSERDIESVKILTETFCSLLGAEPVAMAWVKSACGVSYMYTKVENKNTITHTCTLCLSLHVHSRTWLWRSEFIGPRLTWCWWWSVAFWFGGWSNGWSLSSNVTSR